VDVRFAGVAARDGALVVSGGRVLTVVSRAPHYAEAIAAAYEAVRRIRFRGMQYRTDIGARALAAVRS
jgi:phosphoribosylamine--glycine ligase